MAERRMFAKTIIDSDAFLDMPLSTQALYFHLSMRADDEGFVNNPRKIQRMIGAADDDLKVLITKKFIIPFESGIVVIKHWKIHNYIRGDRLKETVYQEEAAKLEVKENGAYTLVSDNCLSNVSQMSDNCLSNDGIGKDRIGKERIGQDRIEKTPSASAYESIISEFVLDDGVKEAVREFIKMRKQIKSPMTDHALKLMINKLREMSMNPEEQIAILNQSIMNSWKGIFPLTKVDGKASKNRVAAEMEQSYEMISKWAESEDE